MIKTIPLLPQRKNAETMKLQIIDTGYFYADGGAMFGAIPKSAWSRRYPSDETNGCVLAMRSLVIKTDDGRIVLVDNGAGNKHLKQLSYYRFFNLVDLGTELRNRGIQPEEITDVVLTHLISIIAVIPRKRMNLPDIYFSHSQMRTTGLAASNGRISFIRTPWRKIPILSRICKPSRMLIPYGC